MRDGNAESVKVDVMTTSDAPPSTKIYDQTLPTGFDADGKPIEDVDADGKKVQTGGYGYLTTRDGTKLAINVHLPGPASKGPYPTVIEYSGYAYAWPGAGHRASPRHLRARSASPYVDVNMRGTGCSRRRLRLLRARSSRSTATTSSRPSPRQPWVANNRVGMVGISYPRDQPAVRRCRPSPPQPGGDHARSA